MALDNCSTLKCSPPPRFVNPTLPPPGFFLSHATYSGTVLNGWFAPAEITLGTYARCAMGMKSFSAS